MTSSEEKLPTLLELIKEYKEGTLSEEKVYRYQSISGTHLIHIDELKKEVAMASIYGGVHKEKTVIPKPKK